MAKPYYLCAYGHAIRVSDRVTPNHMAEHNASLNTFGIGLGGSERTGVTMIRMEGRGWKYLSAKDKRAKMIELARLHKKRTGNIAGGFNKETEDVQGPEEK